MQTETYFSVSEDIARRSGMIGQRYMTKDGRYILSDRDLRSLRLEPLEYIHGIDVEMLSRDEAKTAIAEGGYKMTEDPVEEPAGETEDPDTGDDVTDGDEGEPSGDGEEETVQDTEEVNNEETEGKEDDHE